ncbi:hypothetical protein MMC25_005830 [Agyrium rufum]|nr:hypothetical protein [Agyrium rufum]
MLTWPWCVAYSILLGISTQYGTGLHVWQFTPELMQGYSKWIYISSVTYLFALHGYKLTILLLYHKLFDVHTVFKFANWTLVFVVSGYLFSNFVTLLFGCSPIQKYWIPDLPGHCITTLTADRFYGSLNFITDLLIFVLPLPLVWNLKLSRNEKLGVTLIFGGGAVNCAIAIVRFVAMIRDLRAYDRTYLAAETFLWSALEINTGLACSCTPALRPFFAHVTQRGKIIYSRYRTRLTEGEGAEGGSHSWMWSWRAGSLNSEEGTAAKIAGFGGKGESGGKRGNGFVGLGGGSGNGGRATGKTLLGFDRKNMGGGDEGVTSNLSNWGVGLGLDRVEAASEASDGWREDRRRDDISLEEGRRAEPKSDRELYMDENEI